MNNTFWGGSNNTNKLSPQEQNTGITTNCEVQIIQINLALKNPTEYHTVSTSVQIIQINLALKNPVPVCSYGHYVQIIQINLALKNFHYF